MGSVKHVITEGLGAHLHLDATPNEFGRDAWQVKGTWSAGDLKDKMPDREIEGKSIGLAMMSSQYMEHLENSGFETCYLGMMDKEGKVVTVDTLLKRGETSDVVVMKTANLPKGKEPQDILDYHTAIQQKDVTVYVADAELIFRTGLPLGSSMFKEMAEALGKKDAYDRVATFEDTVVLLDKMRSMVEQNGLRKFPKLKQILEALGIGAIPNPGCMLPETRYDYWTKFELQGDEHIDIEEVRKRNGLTHEQMNHVLALHREISSDQIAFSRSKNELNIDGKIEVVIYHGQPKVTDFANSPDENRNMLRYKIHGIEYMLPTNKEIGRAILREAGMYHAISQAKARAGLDGTIERWRDHFGSFISWPELMEANERACRLQSGIIQLMTNSRMGVRIFDQAPTLVDIADELIPYASRPQENQPKN